MSESPDKPIAIPAPEPGKQALPERRSGFRFPFTAAAEVYDLCSQARVSGRCSDLSLGGCYVDTLSPFAVGTRVRVHIARHPHEFEAVAVVSYAHVSMGMGLAFSEIKPEHRAVLRSWIAELSGEPPPEPEMNVTEPEGGQAATIENVRQVMNEIINLMVRRRVITEKEAAALLRRIFR